MPCQPLLIGLTGAIGAGKSAVLAAFARRGCATLSADTIVHTLYHQAPVRDGIVERFGGEMLGPDGEIDRAAVAAQVFGDSAELAWLERKLHPLVADHLATWVAEIRSRSSQPLLIVYESPLLFETGQQDRFDRTLVVTASDADRHGRLTRRGGLERLAEREQRQWTDLERNAAADDLIDNSGSLEALEQQVDAYIARYAGVRCGG